MERWQYLQGKLKKKLGFFIPDSNPLLLKLRALPNELSFLTKKSINTYPYLPHKLATRVLAV